VNGRPDTRHPRAGSTDHGGEHGSSARRSTGFPRIASHHRHRRPRQPTPRRPPRCRWATVRGVLLQRIFLCPQPRGWRHSSRRCSERPSGRVPNDWPRFGGAFLCIARNQIGRIRIIRVLIRAGPGLTPPCPRAEVGTIFTPHRAPVTSSESCRCDVLLAQSHTNGGNFVPAFLSVGQYITYALLGRFLPRLGPPATLAAPSLCPCARRNEPATRASARPTRPVPPLAA
jgi:hypothetical protein